MDARSAVPGRTTRGAWRHAVAIAAISVAAGGASCNGSHGGAEPGVASTPATPPLGRSLRRLSHREYDNVVRDLLGDTTQPASRFGNEVYVNGFDNGSDGLIVQGSDVVDFQTAAEALAATAVTGNLTALIGSCNPPGNEMACVDAFLSGFTKKAYRRPPTPTEAQRLRAVYTAGAASGGFEGGIQLMVEAVLQSPAFLYREELGVADSSLPANVVRLTPYEVATELSFLVTGSMPDDTLFAAVDGGTFVTADNFRAQAVRLMASPAARPAFRSFFNQWMATNLVSSTDKDAILYPSFTPAVAASMAGELGQYFDEVLGSDTGSLRELFTSTKGFVDPNLAAVYGVPAPAGTGLQPVALDAQNRQGVMTRAGFLTAHADTDSSGPVPRGVFVLQSILCSPPHPPPPNIPVAPPASVAVANHQTTRQLFTAHLTYSFCAGCHDTIDGIGFGFEQFDGTGVYRTTENGNAVDTSGSLVGTDVDGPFVGVSQLEQKLVTSQQVLGCFVKQAYRFAMGQEESADGAPVLASMGAGLDADSRLTDVFVTLVTDPAFTTRTTLATGP